MISCFLQHGNCPSLKIILKLLLIFTLFAACKSEPLTYETTSTKCNLTFDTLHNETSNNQMHLISCVQKLCLKNLMGGHCANQQHFQFQQQKCFRECCGSNQFDFIKCQQFNSKRMLRHSSQDQKLVIALLASLLGLLVAVIVFAIFYLKCCDNTSHNKISKNNQNLFQWKDCKFNSQKQCHYCKGKGAFVMIACGLYFHLKCMSGNQKWCCNHCQKQIKKVKLNCPICLRKSIKITASNFYELDKKINQMYEFHPEKCFEYMGQQMDTQRKFTQSTKQ